MCITLSLPIVVQKLLEPEQNVAYRIVDYGILKRKMILFTVILFVVPKIMHCKDMFLLCTKRFCILLSLLDVHENFYEI